MTRFASSTWRRATSRSEMSASVPHTSASALRRSSTTGSGQRPSSGATALSFPRQVWLAGSVAQPRPYLLKRSIEIFAEVASASTVDPDFGRNPEHRGHGGDRQSHGELIHGRGPSTPT